MRKGLPDGLSYCQVLSFDRHVPSLSVSSSEDVVAGIRPLGFSGLLYSQRLDQDVPSSVAAEVALVSSIGQFSRFTPSFGGMQALHQFMASRGEVGIRSPSLVSRFSLLLFTDVLRTGWGHMYRI